MAVKYGINHVSECAVYGSFDTEEAANSALEERLADADDANEDDYEIVQLRESIDEMVVTSDSEDEDSEDEA
jgi:hypothetical protein